jgi:CDP-4-dehydro-6-deoxyglucose reductase
MPLIPWRQAIITRVEEEAPGTRRFWLQVPELECFDFVPGQFVTLDLPIHEKANKRWRSYSIASRPDGTNSFELIILLDPLGSGTNYLFNETTVGSTLTFRGAQGVFTLKHPLEQPLILVCTGTGIAPFRSMVQDIFHRELPHQHIHLVFGCRTKDTLLYYDEMQQLAADQPGFHYYPVLSREAWQGHTGYVHLVYEALCKENAAANVFLCGWKGMIDEARQRLQDLGIDKKQIHFEIYG